MSTIMGNTLSMSSKSEDLLEAWGALFMSHALAVRQIEDRLGGDSPLSLDEYNMLLGISRAPGGRIRFSALAAATVFTRSGITRVTKRLEERGFIERVGCSEDRRGVYAVLTPKGREAMRDTWRRYSREILAVFEPCFNQIEARQLTELLGRLIGSLHNEPLVQIGR